MYMQKDTKYFPLAIPELSFNIKSNLKTSKNIKTVFYQLSQMIPLFLLEVNANSKYTVWLKCMCSPDQMRGKSHHL